MSALRYNDGKPKLSRVWWGILTPIAKVLEFGATKYDWDNWKKGLDRQELLDSLGRHVQALMDDELHDEDSKLHHIAHILCNCMFYWFFFNKKEKLFKDGKKNWHLNHLPKIVKKYK